MFKSKLHNTVLKKDVPELTEEEKKTTHEHEDKGIVRRTQFQTEEEKEAYVEWLNKSRYYMRYFFLGVALNFMVYYLGMNYNPAIIYPMATNITVGFLVGIGVPMAVMFGGAELHYWIKVKSRKEQA